MRDRCKSLGATVIGEDFLKVAPVPDYDLVLMNPPFTKGKDRRHVEHAWKFLNHRGQLIAITSVSVVGRIQRGELHLPDCEYCVYERIAKDAFKESGASVETLLVTAEKGASGAVLGFSNLATANAAMVIENDSSIRGHPVHFVSDRYIPQIAETGGSVYGIRRDEVRDHFREKQS